MDKRRLAYELGKKMADKYISITNTNEKILLSKILMSFNEINGFAMILQIGPDKCYELMERLIEDSKEQLKLLRVEDSDGFVCCPCWRVGCSLDLGSDPGEARETSRS